MRVTEDELDREIHSLARQANQPPEGIRERLEKQGTLDRIRARIRNEKTLDFLYRQSA